MDLLGIRRRRLLLIERYRRIKENAYIYYSKEGHFIRECLEANKKLVGSIVVVVEVEEKAGKE